MRNSRQRSHDRDLDILISLATSIGMVVLTIVGWLMWEMFVRVLP
ncbi:hypothetical protein [Nitrospira sp. Kam-Ns4a]